MNRIFKVSPSFLWMLLAVFMFSCKSQRDNPSKVYLGKMELSSLMDSIKTNEANPNLLAMRAKVSFKVEKTSESFKMHVRLKKDSVIWISATYYKVEVARFLFHPDSVIMIDRKNGKYYRGSYQFIQDKFQMPFNFSALQSILLGNTFDLEKSAKIKNSTSLGKHVLQAQMIQSVMDSASNETPEEVKRAYTFWIKPDDFRISRTKINEAKSKKGMMISYGDWQKIDNDWIPFLADCKVVERDDISFKAEYSKIESVEDQTYPLTISSKYEPYF